MASVIARRASARDIVSRSCLHASETTVATRHRLHAAHPRGGCRHGFTLVELLVVIAIIAVLIALLMPAIQNVRESSRRGQCSNNLKQLAIAAEAHKTLLGHFPTGGWSAARIGDPDAGSDWRQPGGWCFAALPFMEQKNLYALAGTNPAVFVTTNVPAFACPTRRGSSLSPLSGGGVGAQTDYAANRGSWAASPTTPSNADTTNRTTLFGADTLGTVLPPADASALQTAWQKLNTAQMPPLSGAAVPTGGVIFAGSSTAVASMRDGTSNTYLMAEKYVPLLDYASGSNPGFDHCAYVGDSADTLRGGQRVPESDAVPFANGLEGVFGGPHALGFIAAMCDTSVKVIGFDIDARVHFLLAAKADGQSVQVPD